MLQTQSFSIPDGNSPGWAVVPIVNVARLPCCLQTQRQHPPRCYHDSPPTIRLLTLGQVTGFVIGCRAVSKRSRLRHALIGCGALSSHVTAATKTAQGSPTSDPWPPHQQPAVTNTQKSQPRSHLPTSSAPHSTCLEVFPSISHLCILHCSLDYPFCSA